MVVKHQDVMTVQFQIPRGTLGHGGLLRLGVWERESETRAMPRERFQGDCGAEQIGGPLHDRKPKTEALPRASWLGQPLELSEDRSLILGRDAE